MIASVPQEQVGGAVVESVLGELGDEVTWGLGDEVTWGLEDEVTWRLGDGVTWGLEDEVSWGDITSPISGKLGHVVAVHSGILKDEMQTGHAESAYVYM